MFWILWSTWYFHHGFSCAKVWGIITIKCSFCIVYRILWVFINHSLHVEYCLYWFSYIKPLCTTWSRRIIFVNMWLYFFYSISLRILVFPFISEIILQLCLFVWSLSGFGIMVMVASQNVIRSILPPVPTSWGLGSQPGSHAHLAFTWLLGSLCLCGELFTHWASLPEPRAPI